jgi:hypothetical protein
LGLRAVSESEKIKPPHSRSTDDLMYPSEKQLVEQFVRTLVCRDSNPWGQLEVSCEFFYARGRTDVVAILDGNMLIAFEAKLRDWRSALDQAYRNTCFAHKSYVVVPQSTALTAFAYVAEFRSRCVGLCYVDQLGRLAVLEEPEVSAPIEPWITSRAASYVRSENEVA